MTKYIVGILLVAGLAYGQDPTKFGSVTVEGDLIVTGSSTIPGFTGSTLAPGRIYVGNAASNATGVAVSGDVTVATNGAVTIANEAVTAAKTATAVQTSLGKADTALQPNAVAVTNVIVGVGDITNTIVVIGGQITSWTVAGE